MALILIADDSPTELYALKSLLERHRHEVILADNGEEASQIAEVRQPNLILMDVVMPVLNGFQATRQLSKNHDTRHIPIIIVSSKNQESDRLWGFRQGAKGYLGKPIDESLLLDQVDRLLSSAK